MILNTIIFIFGLIVGSFLNVVICRLEKGESIVKKRSHCVKCGHVLAWYELIPIVSFIVQRGKCKKCKQGISWQYPFVELATALVFVFIILNFEFRISNEFLIFEFLNIAYYVVLAAFLIVVFVYDFKHYIIPDKILYPAILLVITSRVGEFLALNHWNFIQNSKFKIQNSEALYEPLAAALISALFFASIFVVSKGRWLGFGDVKFAFFMGLLLGWPSILVGIFFGWTLGGIIGLVLLASGKKTLKSKIPFGPFLAAGTFIGLLWGGRIWEWYMSFLL